MIEATTAAMRRWREEVVALSLRGYGYGNEDDDRPEKPRRYGVTEMRSPFYSFRPANQALQVRCRFTPVPTSRRPAPVLCSKPPIRLVLGCAELDWTHSGLILSARFGFGLPSEREFATRTNRHEIRFLLFRLKPYE